MDKILDNSSTSENSKVIEGYLEISSNGMYDAMCYRRRIEYLKDEVEKGSISARLQLSLLYQKNPALAPDNSSFIYLLIEAADAESMEAHYRLGTIHYNESSCNGQKKAITYFNNVISMYEDNKFINIFAKPVPEEYIGSHYYLGKIYNNTKYNLHNHAKALNHLRIASKPYSIVQKSLYRSKCSPKIHSEAQYELAKLYEKEKNFQMADKLYKKAAHNNHVESQYIYGLKQCVNYNASVDNRKPLKYLCKAAQKNHQLAKLKMGELLSKKNDTAEAEFWYSNVSENDNAEALCRLGNIALQNLIFLEAINYFKKSAAKKNIEAHYQLGIIYLSGYHNDGTSDVDSAIDCFKKAANSKHVEATYTLGLFYLFNHHLDDNIIDDNIENAVHYLQQAASQKCAAANYLLGMLRNELSYHHNREKIKEIAKENFKQSEENKLPWALNSQTFREHQGKIRNLIEHMSSESLERLAATTIEICSSNESARPPHGLSSSSALTNTALATPLGRV